MLWFKSPLKGMVDLTVLGLFLTRLLDNATLSGIWLNSKKTITKSGILVLNKCHNSIRLNCAVEVLLFDRMHFCRLECNLRLMFCSDIRT